ncbi:MAG: tRNA1(Val) (adenine(37)-N6)-methyltransferase [Acholeplasmataceae bacterium]|jgi:tRNA1(Val) A37 N6-methylase TrmN6|nr:tRNA1(Val) (adenine(37)-N6)-methyltransferase [Acholeplasmataceae bacterium]
MKLNVVKNDLLGYPKYIIYQNPEMFSFSIDSMLLADFVDIKKDTKKIIDLGTGNGVIPMYLTLSTNANIIGVDIQEDVLNLAKLSVEENGLSNQITLLNRDIKGLSCEYKNIDVVISNPPYFKYKETSIVNKTDYKTIARHEVLITLEEIIMEAYKLLKPRGCFYLIHKPDRLTDVLYYLRKHNLEPKKIRFVYPKLNSKPNHVLVEARKQANLGNLTVLKPLYIYKNGKWTEEVLKIYNKGR